MHKKLLALILAISCILSSVPVMAQETAEYVALGDSIAYGYGLPDLETESYPALFAKRNNLSLVNYGKNGLNSEQLLTAINNNEYALSGASVITVSIGSNDLLQPVLAIIAQELGIDIASTTDITQAINERIAYLLETETTNQVVIRFSNIKDILSGNAQLYAACENYANNMLPQIVSAIRAKNPTAQLFITNIYNPYYNMEAILPVNETMLLTYNIGQLCQPYINRINKGFKQSEDYTYIDLSSEFNRPGYVNASLDMRDMETFSFDPHPTRFGHVIINYALNKVYIAPEPDPTPTPDPEPKPDPEPDVAPLYGDVNSDGKIEASDAALTMQYTLNKAAVVLNYEELIKADVTGDGTIDASDAAEIMQKALVSSYIFTVEE